MGIIPSEEAQTENDAARAENLSRRVLDLEAECAQWHVVCREQRERIAELKAALRKWREDYRLMTRNDGEPFAYVPVHQINALLNDVIHK